MTPQPSIAHYRIVSKLGEGGMGAVYRATDTKLNRDVAIKILPDSLAADADYLARFTREAQVLAALNHPNIAAVYGVEERAIVMELVDGHDLPLGLSLEEALPIAHQIALALEAAHEKGIVHRDLKPANIKLTSDGAVKVLDFGLAKAGDTSAAPANLTASPTLTVRATQAGMIMGTAAYMSPEQAAGKPVDRRADIWAFGVVLYEMLTGRPLFTGDTISHILAGVLKDPIDLSPIPSPVRPLLARCLDRDPRTRLRDIGEARVWLSAPPPEPAEISPAAARQRAPWIGAGAAALALAALAAVHFRETPPAPPATVRFEISVPANAAVGRFVSLSPDGRTLAWSDGASIYLRSIDGFEPRVLTTARIDGYMFWSPDGKQLGFQSGSAIRRIPLAGGVAQTITERVPALGIAWTPDDKLIIGGNTQGLLRVPVSGGAPAPIKVAGLPTDVIALSWPVLLPGARSLLFTVIKNQQPAALVAADFQPDGSLANVREILAARQGAQYFTDASGRGHLLFIRGATLMAQPFDVRSAKLGGEPSVIADAVGIYLTRAFFAAANGGALVFRTGEAGGNRPHLVDRQGKTESVVSIPFGVQEISLSPDGRSLLATVTKGDGVTAIWVLDPVRGAHTRVTLEDSAANRPLWSPDGKRVAYLDVGLWMRSANGVGAAENVAPRALPWAWSHDGKQLLVSSGSRASAPGGLSLLALEDRQPVPLIPSKFNITQAQFSADDRWIAYTSDESGEPEVYVQRAAPAGERIRISNSGGVQPRWRRDGKELFYVEPGGKLMSVALRYAKTLDADAPVALFDARLSSATPNTPARYDVTPDGRHFWLSRFPEAQNTNPLRVILHWQGPGR